MPVKRDSVRGVLIEANVPETLKWGTPRAFIKVLTKALAVTLPFSKNSDFVVYGSQTPSEDDKNKVWCADYSQGSFLGWFRFQKGAWRQVFNRLPTEIIWITGSSLDIPKGHKLIDGTVNNISVANQNHIIKMYRKDPSIVPPAAPVYTYFAVVWVGY